MKRLLLLFPLLFLASLSILRAQSRVITKFTKEWKFYLGNNDSASSPSFNDASWRVLNLPHDWSIELPFDSTSPTGNGGGALRGGLAWYRKTFTLPATSK